MIPLLVTPGHLVESGRNMFVVDRSVGTLNFALQLAGGPEC